jgi:putative spermidine/putrescine transport system permease protein
LRPGLLVAALFAFIQSFDEAVVALFISGQNATTLPRKMFASIREQSDPVIAVVSTLLFALVLLALVAPYALGVARRRLVAQVEAQVQ